MAVAMVGANFLLTKHTIRWWWLRVKECAFFSVPMKKTKTLTLYEGHKIPLNAIIFFYSLAHLFVCFATNIWVNTIKIDDFTVFHQSTPCSMFIIILHTYFIFWLYSHFVVLAVYASNGAAKPLEIKTILHANRWHVFFSLFSSCCCLKMKFFHQRHLCHSSGKWGFVRAKTYTNRHKHTQIETDTMRCTMYTHNTFNGPTMIVTSHRNSWHLIDFCTIRQLLSVSINWWQTSIPFLWHRMKCWKWDGQWRLANGSGSDNARRGDGGENGTTVETT